MDISAPNLIAPLVADRLAQSHIGSRALMFDAPGEFEISVQQRIWGLADHISDWPEVEEIVAGVTNLLVVLTRTGCLDAMALADRIQKAWQILPPKTIAGRLIEIPVTYGGEAAIDLEAVAKRNGLTPSDVIRIHEEGRYTVVTVASSPGFGYLHGLDHRIHMPRKTTPSLNMPAGSVTIGGMLTGVAVTTGPNGWNAIGFSEMRLFDATAADPSMLKSGDHVRFRAERVLL
ncbi:MAG: 5-oxoprolinase subunit PxpB [Devosia sp.]|nr:5-oxoprolinase subunit PxpB [Devosia sp.]